MQHNTEICGLLSTPLPQNAGGTFPVTVCKTHCISKAGGVKIIEQLLFCLFEK